MRISKRNPIFILVSILTFALGVWVTTRVEQPQLLLVLRQSPWQLLLTFENQDLRGLDEQHKRMVEKALEAITGKRNENALINHFEPALFRSMLNAKGEKRYVLAELATPWTIPGSSRLRIHVFDAAGRILNAQEFDTGNRTFVTSMRIGHYGAIERQLLIVVGEYQLTDHLFTHYYGLTGDGMEQLYLQKDGQLDSENNK
jgi:hypothetical protein